MATNSSSSTNPRHKEEKGTQQQQLAEEKVPDRAKFEDYETKTAEAASGDARFRAFEQWLVDNGAEFSEVQLKAYSANMRGVHTRGEVPAHTCIVSIPLKCLITDLMGRTQTEYGKRVFAPDANAQLSAPTLIAVVLYILEMKNNPASFFKPYFDILPTDWSDFPVFWSEENLTSWLRGSPLIRDVRERLRCMRSDFEEIRRLCGPIFRHSFDEFLRVRTGVGSRNFGIIVEGEKRTSMVPFADMLNHFRPRETSWTFDSQRGHFTITTLTRLAPGQQVMDSYGRKDNSRFLLHYGFAVEVNREEDGRCQNEVAITLRVQSSAKRRGASSGARRGGRRPERRQELGVPDDGAVNGHTHESDDDQDEEGSDDDDDLDDEDDDDDDDEDEDAADESEENEDQVIGEEEGAGNLGAAALGSMKRALLGADKSKRVFKVTMNREDKGTADALSFARVVAANEDELVQLVARSTQAAVALSSAKYLCPRNEAAALGVLAEACRAQLARYEQSYTENLALLGSNLLRPFSPRRSALVVIVGEQEICSYWNHAAKVLGDALLWTGGSPREALQRVATVPQGSDASFWVRDMARHAGWLLSAVTAGEGRSKSAF